MLFLSYLCLCGYYAPYSHSTFSFSVIFYAVFFSCISLLFCSLCYVLVLSFVVDAVFFVDLPILLPSVGFSPLLCVIIRLGVFRGSEAKKWGFVLWLYGIYTEKGRTRHLCAPSALCLWLCHFLCRNDVVLLCGLSVLTFPVTVGVMLS